jgi:hypothetical protein
VTINNGMEWSIAGWDSIDGNFNATPANPHVFNGTPTIQLFQGRTAAAASESIMTFAGPITGGWILRFLHRWACRNESE